MRILVEGCIESYVSGVIEIDSEEIEGMTEKEKFQFITNKIIEWKDEQTYRYDGDECDEVEYEIKNKLNNI